MATTTSDLSGLRGFAKLPVVRAGFELDILAIHRRAVRVFAVEEEDARAVIGERDALRPAPSRHAQRMLDRLGEVDELVNSGVGCGRGGQAHRLFAGVRHLGIDRDPRRPARRIPIREVRFEPGIVDAVPGWPGSHDQHGGHE
jgi:hypothetical protein